MTLDWGDQSPQGLFILAALNSGVLEKDDIGVTSLLWKLCRRGQASSVLRALSPAAIKELRLFAQRVLLAGKKSAYNVVADTMGLPAYRDTRKALGANMVGQSVKFDSDALTNFDTINAATPGQVPSNRPGPTIFAFHAHTGDLVAEITLSVLSSDGLNVRKSAEVHMPSGVVVGAELRHGGGEVTVEHLIGLTEQETISFLTKSVEFHDEVEETVRTRLDYGVMLPISCYGRPKGGTAADLMAQRRKTLTRLSACQCCRDVMIMDGLWLEATPSYVRQYCKWSCADCKTNRRVCTACKLLGHTSYHGGARACERCLDAGKVCIRCWDVLWVTDCLASQLSLNKQLDEKWSIANTMPLPLGDIPHAVRCVHRSCCNWWLIIDEFLVNITMLAPLLVVGQPLFKVVHPDVVFNPDRMSSEQLDRLLMQDTVQKIPDGDLFAPMCSSSLAEERWGGNARCVVLQVSKECISIHILTSSDLYSAKLHQPMVPYAGLGGLKEAMDMTVITHLGSPALLVCDGAGLLLVSTRSPTKGARLNDAGEDPQPHAVATLTSTRSQVVGGPVVRPISVSATSAVVGCMLRAGCIEILRSAPGDDMTMFSRVCSVLPPNGLSMRRLCLQQSTNGGYVQVWSTAQDVDSQWRLCTRNVSLTASDTTATAVSNRWQAVMTNVSLVDVVCRHSDRAIIVISSTGATRAISDADNTLIWECHDDLLLWQGPGGDVWRGARCATSVGRSLIVVLSSGAVHVLTRFDPYKRCLAIMRGLMSAIQFGHDHKEVKSSLPNLLSAMTSFSDFVVNWPSAVQECIGMGGRWCCGPNGTSSSQSRDNAQISVRTLQRLRQILAEVMPVGATYSTADIFSRAGSPKALTSYPCEHQFGVVCGGIGGATGKAPTEMLYLQARSVSEQRVFTQRHGKKANVSDPSVKHQHGPHCTQDLDTAYRQVKRHGPIPMRVSAKKPGSAAAVAVKMGITIESYNDICKMVLFVTSIPPHARVRQGTRRRDKPTFFENSQNFGTAKDGASSRANQMDDVGSKNVDSSSAGPDRCFEQSLAIGGDFVLLRCTRKQSYKMFWLAKLAPSAAVNVYFGARSSGRLRAEDIVPGFVMVHWYEEADTPWVYTPGLRPDRSLHIDKVDTRAIFAKVQPEPVTNSDDVCLCQEEIESLTHRPLVNRAGEGDTASTDSEPVSESSGSSESSDEADKEEDFTLFSQGHATAYTTRSGRQTNRRDVTGNPLPPHLQSLRLRELRAAAKAKGLSSAGSVDELRLRLSAAASGQETRAKQAKTQLHGNGVTSGMKSNPYEVTESKQLAPDIVGVRSNRATRGNIDAKPAATVSSMSRKPSEQAPSRGFRNTGNSCFAGAAVQLLSRVDPLVAALLQPELTAEGPVTVALASAFRFCLGNQPRSFCMDTLLHAISDSTEVSWTWSPRHRRQEDTAEFLEAILASMGTRGKAAIESSLSYVPKVRFTCVETVNDKSCGHERVQETSDHYFTIRLPINVSITPVALMTCLAKDVSLSGEVETDSPTNTCAGICGRQGANRHRQVILDSMSDYACLHIVRFKTQTPEFASGGQFAAMKIGTRLEVPEFLYLGAFMPQRHRALCRLVGGIVHFGESLAHGHFTAIVRRGERWVHYDDSNMDDTLDWSGAQQLLEGAYLLLLQRCETLQVRHTLSVLTPSLCEVFEDPEKVVAVVGNFTLRQHDFASLKDGMLVNDNIINAYFSLLVLRSGTSDTGSRVEAVSSHFFTKWVMDPDAVSTRWKAGEDIFGARLILVPANYARHWVLIVVSPAERRVRVYDSLNCVRSLDYGSAVLAWLLRRPVEPQHVQVSRDPRDWTMELIYATPQQKNGVDCGVFTICAAEALSRDAPLCYSQGDMMQARRSIAADLLLGCAAPSGLKG